MSHKTIIRSGTRLIGIIGACLSLLSAGCGGGGGDPGTNTSTAAANRYSVSVITRPTTSVFYGGSNTSAYVSLAKICDANCGNLPIPDVAGQVITLTASDPSAVTFTPSTAITDSDGNVTVTISAASHSTSGLVNITATASIAGHDYAKTVALNVNNQVDRTITAEDDNIIQEINMTKDCSNYPTIIVNVKNAAGQPSDNSIISIVGADSSVEVAAPKDLGVFDGLGHVWQLQIRPASGVCDTTGSTSVIGRAVFSVDPGDSSGPYTIGYQLDYLSK